MSRWADWIAISPRDAGQLLSAQVLGDEAVYQILSPLLERRDELPLRIEMDKAWEPIHRCLTGDHSPAYEFQFDAGDYPLKLCVFGGHQLLFDGYRSATVIHAKDMDMLAAGLAEISEEWFREKFFTVPDTQMHEIDEPQFRWTWESFVELRVFFEKVATTGQSVICTISH